MSDDADITQARAEAEAELRERRPRVRGLVPFGACYFCAEECAALFCGAECRDDYEIKERALRRNGIK